MSGINVCKFYSLFCYLAFAYADLPDRMPSHFGINGNIDAYAYKSMLLVTPIVFAVISIAMELLRLYPLNMINIIFYNDDSCNSIRVYSVYYSIK